MCSNKTPLRSRQTSQRNTGPSSCKRPQTPSGSTNPFCTCTNDPCFSAAWGPARKSKRTSNDNCHQFPREGSGRHSQVPDRRPHWSALSHRSPLGVREADGKKGACGMFGGSVEPHSMRAEVETGLRGNPLSLTRHI